MVNDDQDHLYPCLCNAVKHTLIAWETQSARVLQGMHNARCHLTCEGTKPVSELTGQVQHLTLISRCLMTQGIKKTESFVMTGWQFLGFVSLEQSDINTVYLKRGSHLWWIDLMQWNEISWETMTIWHLSKFLVQLQGFSLYLACFNENICKICL